MKKPTTPCSLDEHKTDFTRYMYCEDKDCQCVTEHDLEVYEVNPNGVLFMKCCVECFTRHIRKTRNETYFWDIETLPLVEWNALIALNPAMPLPIRH